MSRGTGGSGFHHIEINVSVLARSVEFWGFLLEQLGYEPYQEWPEGRSWSKGGSYLVLVQVPERFLHRAYHRSGVGLNHLAFHGGNPAGVDRLAEALRERRTAMLYEDRYPHAGGPGHYALYCEDPDRIKVEVVAIDDDADG